MKAISEYFDKQIRQQADLDAHFPDRQGFWEDANLFQKRALVVCELAEAIEADRKGRRADIQAMQKRIDEIDLLLCGED